jgi:hypothetical protein
VEIKPKGSGGEKPERKLSSLNLAGDIRKED